MATNKTIIHHLLTGKVNFNVKERYIIDDVKIEPSEAGKLLEMYNERPEGVLQNRPINMARVQKWAVTIKKGDWRPKVGTIAFCTDKWIVNGQHRLKGCEVSGLPITVAIEIGARLEDVGLQNSGVPTSIVYEMSTRGVPNSSRVSPIVAELVKLERGIPAASMKMAGIEVYECYQKHQQLLEYFTEAFPRNPIGGSPLVAATVYAAAVSPKAAKDFTNRYLNKDVNLPGDVCLALSRGMKAKATHGSVERRIVILKTLNAIRAVEQKKDTARVSSTDNGFRHYRDKRVLKGVDVPE